MITRSLLLSVALATVAVPNCLSVAEAQDKVVDAKTTERGPTVPPVAEAQDKVVDAKGKLVGTLHGSPKEAWARLQMRDGVWTALRVSTYGFVSDQSYSPIFVSSEYDCTGVKYFYKSLYNNGVTYKIKAADTNKLFRYPVPPYKQIIVRSAGYWDPNLAEIYCSAYFTPFEAEVAAYKTISLDALKLTPPFTIK